MTSTYSLGVTPCGCTVQIPEEAYRRRTRVEGPCAHDRQWSVEIVQSTKPMTLAAKAAFTEVIEGR